MVNYIDRRIRKRLRRINHRLADAYSHVRNRFFAKYYLLDIKAIPRGQWRDSDYQLFHAVFQILVNFVENEKAHMERICYDAEWAKDHPDETHPDAIAWHNASWWDRWKNRKRWNERLGLAYLEGEAQMDNPNSPHYHEHCERQAEKARQVIALYKWYKYERPARIDPYDAFPAPARAYVHEKTGDPVVGDGIDIMLYDPENEPSLAGRTMRQPTPEYSEYLKKGWELQEQYEEEDTAKAQQVLAIRRGLWT